MSSKRKDEDDCDLPAIVIAGNPRDGFSYYGPFLNTDEANEWADIELRNEEWWVTETTPQLKRSKTFQGVKVIVKGGVVQDCEVDIACPECGAQVGCDEGYVLEDHDNQ